EGGGGGQVEEGRAGGGADERGHVADDDGDVLRRGERRLALLGRRTRHRRPGARHHGLSTCLPRPRHNPTFGVSGKSCALTSRISFGVAAIPTISRRHCSRVISAPSIPPAPTVSSHRVRNCGRSWTASGADGDVFGKPPGGCHRRGSSPLHADPQSSASTDSITVRRSPGMSASAGSHVSMDAKSTTRNIWRPKCGSPASNMASYVPSRLRKN